MFFPHGHLTIFFSHFFRFWTEAWILRQCEKLGSLRNFLRRYCSHPSPPCKLFIFRWLIFFGFVRKSKETHFPEESVRIFECLFLLLVLLYIDYIQSVRAPKQFCKLTNKIHQLQTGQHRCKWQQMCAAPLFGPSPAFWVGCAFLGDNVQFTSIFRCVKSKHDHHWKITKKILLMILSNGFWILFKCTWTNLEQLAMQVLSFT